MLVHLGLAILAYVPFFLSSPGDVGADTKQYLYLDPGQLLLSRAAYLWDANFGGGTVTHQNIGYLWPMGPYYWFTHAARDPGVGRAAVLARLDHVRRRARACCSCSAPSTGAGSGATVAALVYMLSPYPLAYTARISAILLPWAGAAVADRARDRAASGGVAGGIRRSSRSSSSRSAGRTRRR